MLGPLVAAKLGYSPEAQALKKGDPIAHLISIDAEISVKEAEAALATSMGNLNRSIAERRAAKARLEKPVHIQVRHADAKSSLAKAKTELTNLPFQIEAATANLGFASKSVTGKRAAGKATPGVVLQKAEAEFVAAGARLRELKQRKPSLAREIDALEEKVAAIGQQLNLLIEGKRQLDEATAGVQSATAMRDAAALRLQKAQLDLERNTVRAPMDGRVLRLIASPGSRVMGMETNGGHDSTAVVEMYDPQRLQVRADVRLEDVPLIQLGQPVKIETASSQNTIQGRVLQPNSSANIQKNTLEVKVELISPPATVRPEMLVTATFLAPKTETKPDESVQESNRIFIPSQLLESNDNGNSVWIVDANGHAKKQNCTLAGRPRGDELVEINNGLQVTDKLITSGTSDLHDGQRVNITGEDRSIGR
jgi:RND family efflux transporter MFP subunit